MIKKFQNICIAILAMQICFPAGMSAKEAPAQPKIEVTVNVNEEGAPIHPYVHGMFTELLSNMFENGIWAEMLSDRKFFYAVDNSETLNPTNSKRHQLRWRPVGPESSVTMDKANAYVGKQSPLVSLASGKNGIRQASLWLEKGRGYTGRVVPRADKGAKVSVSLVWGKGSSERQTIVFDNIKKEYNIFRDKNRVLQLTPEHIVMYANNNDDTRIPYAERDAIAYYVKFKKEFSDAVVRVNEYLKLHISGEISTRKIDLGIPLWFLNYVSFSFDGKMMSVAGRYPDNTQDENSGSISGLFLLYDIEKDKITFRKTNTNAVWVSAFNKDNLVACYDSCPGSYIMDAETPDSKIIRMENDSHAGQNRILGRSFLCFSPSGKLMAMSKQGYVRYENATEERPWGHQPSTCVYIRSSKDLNNDIAQFNDHGSGISGVATRARTVSMVAFSPDDSKMLSVSNDGVVVVRNLHIEL